MSDIEYKEGFTPQNEAREISVTVAEGVQAPNSVFTVQFGTLEQSPDKEGKPRPTVGRWTLTRSMIKDGKAENHTVYGTDPAKMIDNAIMIVYGQMNVPADQVFHDADLEDEFFAQKLEVIKDDVWKMSEYKDKLEDFAEARGQLEEVLEQAEASAVTTQEDYVNIANILVDLKEKVNGDMALLRSIVLGTDGASNQPRLAKLGKGVNALREAMWLAGISEGEMQILPVSITSGKAGERHVNRSIQAIAATSYIKEVEFDYYDVEDKDAVFLPTPESLGHMMRAIADKSFGVKEARSKSDGEYTTSLGDVASLVNEAAIAQAVDFRSKYGKHADTSDNDQYKDVLQAFGAIRCSDAGAVNLFAEAVLLIEDAVDSDGYVIKLLSATNNRGNLLLRHAVNNARQMIESNKKTAEIKETLEEVDVDKVDAVSVKDMSAAAKAAYHYKLMAAYPDAGDVVNEFRALLANKALENVKPVKVD